MKTEKIYTFPLDDTIELTGESNRSGFTDVTIPIVLTWREFLSIFGSHILNGVRLFSIKYDLSEIFFGRNEPMFFLMQKDVNKIMILLQKACIISVQEETVVLTQEGINLLYDNLLNVDELLKDIVLNKNNIISKTLNVKTQFEKYINRVSDFSSNPEHDKYIGKTLIEIYSFLFTQSMLSQEDTKYAQNLINKILEECSENVYEDDEMIIPLFDLSKMLKLIDIMHQSLQVLDATSGE